MVFMSEAMNIKQKIKGAWQWGLRCGLVIALLCLGSGAAAQQEKITVSFDNAPLIQVIRWAADLTDKNIIVHENAKSKKITVIAGEPMTKQEAYEAFLSVLQVNGFAVVETEGALKIFPSQVAKTNAVPLLEDAEGAAEDDLVIHIVKVNNVAAPQLSNIIKPLIPNTAHIMPHANTNILIVAARVKNIEQILKLVEQIDTAGTIDIEVIALKHASAKEIIDLISSLVPKIVGGEGAPQSQALHFAADERSNSILMSGDPVVRTQMRKLIERLDQPVAGEGNTHVIYLDYADAKEMATMLESVSGTVVETGKDQQIVQSEISILAHEGNNALVVTAPPSIMNTIKSVVEKLDIRREQVLVEALLLEVNDGVARDFGVFWQTSDTADGVGGAGIFGVTADDSSNLPAVGDNATPGLLLGYFSNGDLRGLINAVEATDGANVLSKPTIMALDNEEAEILVGENVPFKTGITERDSTNDFVSIEREDIGIQLKVKPQINPNNMLTLEIEQKVESINTTSVAGASDLITNKREIKTTALVRNNEILVLGGLVRDELLDTETKVPFLGDIPGLGWLFKGTSKQLTKKNLMVFIQPRILYSDEDNRRVTEERYNSMRELEQIYNERNNFFTIEKEAKPLIDEFESNINVVTPVQAGEEAGIEGEAAETSGE